MCQVLMPHHPSYPAWNQPMSQDRSDLDDTESQDFVPSSVNYPVFGADKPAYGPTVIPPSSYPQSQPPYFTGFSDDNAATNLNVLPYTAPFSFYQDLPQHSYHAATDILTPGAESADDDSTQTGHVSSPHVDSPADGGHGPHGDGARFYNSEGSGRRSVSLPWHSRADLLSSVSTHDSRRAHLRTQNILQAVQFFVQGDPGIRLRNALNMQFAGLDDPQTSAIQASSPKFGWRLLFSNISVINGQFRPKKTKTGIIDRRMLAYKVASMVQKYLTLNRLRYRSSDGLQGDATLENLFLTEIRQVRKATLEISLSILIPVPTTGDSPEYELVPCSGLQWTQTAGAGDGCNTAV